MKLYVITTGKNKCTKFDQSSFSDINIKNVKAQNSYHLSASPFTAQILLTGA